MNQIIIAQSTPTGTGALAIIRLSGLHTRTLVDSMIKLKSKQKLVDIPSHTIHYGTCYNAYQKAIDHVMIAIMDGPRSFTGENSAEITCHNNPFIISAIIERAISLGARIAKPGEFTERALLNNKIDVFQAEAIHDLLTAQNEITTQAALSQLNGSLGSHITKIEVMINEINAWCNANFEFLEEERDFREIIISKIHTTINYINDLITKNSITTMLHKGFTVGIIGSVNVGKSSLINALLGKERAIVSHIAGTTRDSIEATMTIDKYQITFIDTAGIRNTKNIIENEGIKKSLEILASSDIILLVYTEEVIENQSIKNWYEKVYAENKEKMIVIKNKVDLYNTKSFFNEELLCTNKNILSTQQVCKSIKDFIEKKFTFQTPEYILNCRHIKQLDLVKKNLSDIADDLSQKTIFFEIIIEKLFQTQEILSSLQAKSIRNNVFEEIFKNFCVGK